MNRRTLFYGQYDECGLSLLMSSVNYLSMQYRFSELIVGPVQCRSIVSTYSHDIDVYIHAIRIVLKGYVVCLCYTQASIALHPIPSTSIFTHHFDQLLPGLSVLFWMFFHKVVSKRQKPFAFEV